MLKSTQNDDYTLVLSDFCYCVQRVYLCVRTVNFNALDMCYLRWPD
jgi:hypothetical protein